MSRRGSAPTATEWIRGWITSDGTRHPGILERLDVIEKGVAKQGRLLYIVLAAVLFDAASNSKGELLHYLQDAAQIISSFIF